MLRRYDLLVIDLDGTLLSSRGTVSPRNRAAIDRARDAGLTVIVATGRAMVESGDAIEAIEHTGLVIGAGGAILSEVRTGRTIERQAMPSDLVHEVTNALLHHGHKVLLLKDPDVAGYDYLAVGPGELDHASRWWFETLPVRVRFVHDIDEDPHPDDTVRVGAVASEAELGPIADQLQRDVGDRAFLQHWAAVTETGERGGATHLLEVFNPRVNKWTMVLDQCRRLDIDASRVMAVGDGINDVQLIRNAGLGIAMANADEPVLAVADRVTGHHDEDGLAEAIEQVLDGLW